MEPEKSPGTGDSKDESKEGELPEGGEFSCDEVPCLRIEPKTILCQMHRNNSGPEFELPFAYKSVLELEPGLFPLPGGVKLRGVLRNGVQTVPFNSESADFEINQDGDDLVAVSGDLALNTQDDQELSLHLFVTPRSETEKPGLFILDDLESIDVAGEAKQVFVSAQDPTPVMGNAMSSMFTACSLEEEDAEDFNFRFKDGSTLALSVRSRLWSWIGRFQTGVLSRATGTFAGQVINVTDRMMLAYSSKYQTDFLRLPTLALRYASNISEKGACGVGFEPTSNEKRPYKAYLLNCENKVIEELALESSSYPDRYSVLP